MYETGETEQIPYLSEIQEGISMIENKLGIGSNKTSPSECTSSIPVSNSTLSNKIRILSSISSRIADINKELSNLSSI